jgi:hypothetical protein
MKEIKINAFPFCFQRIPGKKTKVWSVLDETTLSFFQENKVLKITFYSYFVLWKYTKDVTRIRITRYIPFLYRDVINYIWHNDLFMM